MSARLRLYDLAGADDAWRFSPNCWRVRLALAHKRLPVETVPWRFTEKDAIAFSGQGKVPVLVDGERWVFDSWAIAEYLEAHYPDRPSLFGGARARALTRFVNQWVSETLHPLLARLILPDLFAILHPKDRDYFRRTREAAFGTRIEALAEQRGQYRAQFAQGLAPLRSTLAAQPYFAGETPAYADHVVFGAFQWARVSSPQPLLDDGDPIATWRERMLDAYDGLARACPCAHPPSSRRDAAGRV